MHNQNVQGRLLNTGHYAGLKFEEGWFFVHVLETEYAELKPWTLLNENEERAEIAPQTPGSTDDQIVDSVERELVEPRGNEKNLIFQTYLGVSPSRVQIFPFFGRNRSPNLTGGAEPGKPQIFLNGYDSPYNNPSEQSEIFTINSMDTLALQAYNPMTEPAEARVSMHVNKIKYAAVEDVDMMKAFIQGQRPFRDHTMGLGVQDKEQIKAPGWLQDRFGDLIMSTEEILQSGGGGGSSTSAESIGDRFPSASGGGE